MVVWKYIIPITELNANGEATISMPMGAEILCAREQGDQVCAWARVNSDEKRIEKRVFEEYPHVAGTAAEKVLVLKARVGMSEDAQKALDAILLSAEKLARAGFDSLGSQGGLTPTSKAAATSFAEKLTVVSRLLQRVAKAYARAASDDKQAA